MLTILNTFSVFAFVLCVTILSSSRKQISPTFIVLFILQTWSLFSAFYNDLGIWNPELFGYTKPSLASSALAISLTFFFLGFLWADKAINYDARPLGPVTAFSISPQLRQAIILSLSLPIGFLSFVVFASGDAFSVDRVSYLRFASYPEQLLQGLLPFIAFVIGYLRQEGGRLTLSELCLFLILLYLLAIGNKFSYLVFVVLSYVVGLRQDLTIANIGGYLNVKTGVLAALIVILIGSLSIRQYLGQSGSLESALDLLTSRLLAFQGHVWWATFNGSTLFAPSQLASEFRAALLKDFSLGDVGLSYLMVEILGWTRAQQLFDGGYLYTMGFPAIFLKTTPFFAIPLVLFCIGALGGAIVQWLRLFVKQGRMPAAILMFSIFSPYITYVLSGNMFVFLTFELGVKVALLAFMQHIVLTVKE